MKRSFPNRQRGMTLFVGMIMLVLLMLMAISAYNLTRTNTAVTGNMQHRMETTNAAMQAIEETISTTQFFNTPSNAIPGSCGPNKVCVDINHDGTEDITVTLSPAPCIKKIQVIKNVNLNLANPDDAPCALGVSQTLGVAGSSTGDSLCAESVWEINANAQDLVTEAVSTVTTGVAVRVPADNALDTSKACL